MWVLNKRIPRNLKKNLARWCSIFLLVVVCLYLVISLFGEAVQIFYNHHKFMNDYNVNDGSFTAFAEFNEEELSEMENLGFKVEENFYGEFRVLDNDLLRVFKNRKEINKICVVEGRLAENDNEVLIEQNFAQAHDIKIDDSITIAGINFSVCGLGCSPDYEAVAENPSTSTNRDYFGTAFFTDGGYESLIATGQSLKSQAFLYGYKKINSDTDDNVLKKYIEDMDFDETRITDRFFIEKLDEILETKINLENAVNDLSEASDNISSSSADFNSGAQEMRDAISEFNTNIKDLTNGITEINDGAQKLNSNSAALVEGSRSVFKALLANAETQLAENGIIVHLTIENYQTQLKSVNSNSLSQQAQGQIDSLINSLNGVNDFYNGVVNYTQGVGESAAGAGQLNSSVSELSSSVGMLNQNLNQLANVETLSAYLTELNNGYGAVGAGLSQVAQGTQGLTDGLGSLSSNSQSLIDGASQIRESLLSQASAQLADYGINVQLTADSYESQLDSVRNDIPNHMRSQVNQSVNSLTQSLNSYNTFYTGLNDYVSGVAQLNEGVNKLNTANPDLISAASRLNDSAEEFLGYTGDFMDGAQDLRDGVSEFQEHMDDIDEYFDIDVDNLVEFNTFNDITSIMRYANSAASNGITCGIIVVSILSYILSVFVTHEIDNESSVIGALYSMGISKGSLIRHYIAIPVIITLSGGLVGTLIGMSPVGIGYQLNDTLYYNSMPVFEKTISAPLVLCGTLIPPVISAIVTLLIISSRLSKSPLSLLRKEKKVKKLKNSKKMNLSFINTFRIKQIKNEAVTSFIVFIGLLMPLILLMLSLNYLVVQTSVVDDVSHDVKLKNIYAVKYTTEQIPENSEACYMESLSKNYLGSDYDINMMGIQSDSECFYFDTECEKNKVLVGTGMAYKFNIKAGDTITLESHEDNRCYSFIVDDVVQYSPGLTMFMNIDDMRKVFNRDDDYYNSLLAIDDIDIESGRLYSTVTSEGMLDDVKTEMGSIGVLIYILVFAAVMIFIIVTYLMIKLMIDRASLNISLMKIFGFSGKEINKLYVDGNFIIICISSIIGIPLSKILVDKFWFPIMNSGIGIGFNPHYPFWMFIVIMASIIVLYYLVTLILKRKVVSISMTDVLKNRE